MQNFWYSAYRLWRRSQGHHKRSVKEYQYSYHFNFSSTWVYAYPRRCKSVHATSFCAPSALSNPKQYSNNARLCELSGYFIEVDPYPCITSARMRKAGKAVRAGSCKKQSNITDVNAHASLLIKTPFRVRHVLPIAERAVLVGAI